MDKRAFDSPVSGTVPAQSSVATDSDVEFLRRGRWFKTLPAELQALVIERSMVRSYANGAHIIGEGAPPRGLFALLEGRVHIVRGVGESDEALIHVGEPGFWSPEHGMLSGRPAIASVVATTNTRVLLLPTSEFRASSPANRATTRTSQPSCSSVTPTCSATRARRARSPPRTGSGRACRISPPSAATTPSCAVRSTSRCRRRNSTMVGVSRQTLCMLLRRLEERGVIEVAYRKIRVIPEGSRGAKA